MKRAALLRAQFVSVRLDAISGGGDALGITRQHSIEASLVVLKRGQLHHQRQLGALEGNLAGHAAPLFDVAVRGARRTGGRRPINASHH
jgi:hypothetical protein